MEAKPVTNRQRQLLEGIKADLHYWQSWSDDDLGLTRDQRAIASMRARDAKDNRVLRLDYTSWIGSNQTTAERVRCSRDLANLEKAGHVLRLNQWNETGGRTTHIQILGKPASELNGGAGASNEG